MAWFLNFGTYPPLEDPGGFGTVDDLRFGLHALVCTLASKYELQGLSLLAKDCFTKAAKERGEMFVIYDWIPVIYGAQPEPEPGMGCQPKRLVGQFPMLRPELSIIFLLCPGNSLCKANAKGGPGSEGSINRALGHWTRYVDDQRSAYSNRFFEACTDDTSVPLDECGLRYEVALFQTNPQGIENRCCFLKIESYTETYASDSFTTHLGNGAIGKPKTSIKVFKGKFKNMTGLDWADSFDQPLKSHFTFIRDGQHDLLWGWKAT